MNDETPATTRRHALVYALGPVLVTACGGGSSDAPAPAPAPPPAPPVIAVQPASAAVLAGGAVVFSVQPASSGGVSYQWMRDGADLAGATGSTFTHTPVSLLDSGTVFSVRASNEAGTVTSQGATLTVNSPAFALIAGRSGTPGFVDGAAGVALLEEPRAIALDDSGNVYFASAFSAMGRRAIRKITVDGTVTTFAGSRDESSRGFVDGVGSAAQFVQIVALNFDRTRKLLVAVDWFSEFSSSVREVTLAAAVTTEPAVLPYRVFNATLAPDGTQYFSVGTLVQQGGFSISTPDIPTAVFKAPPGQPATLFAGDPRAQGFRDGIGAAAQFGFLRGMAADAAGNVYVGDSRHLRKIAPDGTVKMLAGSEDQSFVRVDGQGSAARFQFPGTLVMESTGNVLVYDNDWIRRVTPEGRVITVAKIPEFAGTTQGAALDSAGRLYISGGYWIGRFDAFAS